MAVVSNDKDAKVSNPNETRPAEHLLFEYSLDTANISALRLMPSPIDSKSQVNSTFLTSDCLKLFKLARCIKYVVPAISQGKSPGVVESRGISSTNSSRLQVTAMTNSFSDIPKDKIFDRIYIASPCKVDWDSMTGDERTRFCQQCQLHVSP